MHIKLTCRTCGEKLESMAVFTDNAEIEFLIDPCTSFTCTEEEDPNPDAEPLPMPYSTLVRILEGKEVTVTYRKVNRDIRELTGFLGHLKGLSDGNLVYFHELIGGTPPTACKCLIIDRILSVDHYNDGVHTSYTVLEAL